MTGRTHDAAALTFLIVAAGLYPLATLTLSTALVAILANQIGGIAPDIDQPTAPIWRNLPFEGIFAKVTDALVGGHRFLTHSILGAGIMSLLAHVLLVFMHPITPSLDINIIWWSFNVGIFSHLVMDTLTKEGVPWFLPIPAKLGFPPIKDLRITTGHAVETFIVFPVLIALDVVLIAHNYQAIVHFLNTHLQA